MFLKLKSFTPSGVDESANDVTPGLGVGARPELGQAIPTYLCPADKRDTTTPCYGAVSKYARSSYVCNREVLGPDVSSKPTKIKLVAMPDGSSNTIMVGERDWVQGVGAIWPITSNTTCSWEGRPGFGINIPYPGGPPQGAGSVTTALSTVRQSWISQHAGGVNFVFCDGHVQFIANSVESDPIGDFGVFPAPYRDYVLTNLTHPDDGNTLKPY